MLLFTCVHVMYNECIFIAMTVCAMYVCVYYKHKMEKYEAAPLTSPFSTRGFTSARSTSCSSRDMSLLFQTYQERKSRRSALPSRITFLE